MPRRPQLNYRYERRRRRSGAEDDDEAPDHNDAVCGIQPHHTGHARISMYNDNETQHNCGYMYEVCQHCGAKYFTMERTISGEYNKCCKKGAVQLPPIATCNLIRILMDGQHPQSQNFKENIRSFNSSLAFASLGAKTATPPGRGPYCFRINGQIYHRKTLPDPKTRQATVGTLYINKLGNPRRERLFYFKDTSSDGSDLVSSM